MKTNLEATKESLQRLLDQLNNGCGNHGCRIKPPTGQGTNSICRCSPRQIAREIRQIAYEIDPTLK